VRERAHMSHSLQFAEKDAVHGLAGLLYWLGNLDKKISARGFINAQSGTATYRALRVVELLGNGWIWLPLPVVVVMFSPRAALRHRALLLSLAVGFIFDILCLGIIKAIFRRPRPKYNAADGLHVLSDKWSFPSGHASRAFLIFALAVRHEKQRLGAFGVVLVLAWAATTSACRIMQGRHYAGDVLAGALLGLLEAAAVMYAPEKLQHALEQPLAGRLVAKSAAAKLSPGTVLRAGRKLLRYTGY